MALTPAERQRLRRARLRAGESVPTCTICGALLQMGRRERTDRQDSTLCWSCWIKTPEGQVAENERKRKHAEANPDLRRQQTRDAVRRHRERQRGDSPPPA